MSWHNEHREQTLSVVLSPSFAEHPFRSHGRAGSVEPQPLLFGGSPSDRGSTTVRGTGFGPRRAKVVASRRGHHQVSDRASRTVPWGARQEGDSGWRATPGAGMGRSAWGRACWCWAAWAAPCSRASSPSGSPNQQTDLESYRGHQRDTSARVRARDAIAYAQRAAGAVRCAAADWGYAAWR